MEVIILLLLGSVFYVMVILYISTYVLLFFSFVIFFGQPVFFLSLQLNIMYIYLLTKVGMLVIVPCLRFGHLSRVMLGSASRLPIEPD